MKTTDQGRQAEAAVADLLREQGFEIIELNWRLPVCEIDIVSQKEGVMFFTEVKFRASSSQGDGFEYITPLKLKKMHFGAKMWVQQKDWNGDYRLLAAAVTGYQMGEISLLEVTD